MVDFIEMHYNTCENTATAAQSSTAVHAATVTSASDDSKKINSGECDIESWHYPPSSH